MKQFVSIVIPTFNGGELFAILMERLQSQSIIDRCEIVIIDSGSSDSTLLTAKQFGAVIHEINQKSFNHGLTRNYGASISTGNLICFLTQDAVPANPFLLENMSNSILKHNAAGCYARQIPRPGASPLVCRDLHQWLSGSETKRITQFSMLTDFLKLAPLETYYSCIFDNVASMMKREVWETIPFSSTPFGEDIEWAFRVLCNGHTIVYEPDAVVEHSHERSSTYLYKRTFIDHYRLFELFGIRTIPSLRLLCKSTIQTTIKDWMYLMHHAQFDPNWFRWMKNVPFDSWASAWGQYQGAKAAAKGIPVFQSKDV